MPDVDRAPNAHIPCDDATDRVEVAVDAFLSQPRFSDDTRRSYRKTLTALTAALRVAGADPTGAAIEAAARLRWGTVAPTTWNRHATTIRSFLGYAARYGLLDELDVDLDRRRELADRTRASPQAALERLWSRRDVALREKTLWRLLHETAARAGEALPLDDRDAGGPVGICNTCGELQPKQVFGRDYPEGSCPMCGAPAPDDQATEAAIAPPWPGTQEPATPRSWLRRKLAALKQRAAGDHGNGPTAVKGDSDDRAGGEELAQRAQPSPQDLQGIVDDELAKDVAEQELWRAEQEALNAASPRPFGRTARDASSGGSQRL